jgi:hypothetical protein
MAKLNKKNKGHEEDDESSEDEPLPGFNIGEYFTS